MIAYLLREKDRTLNRKLATAVANLFLISVTVLHPALADDFKLFGLGGNYSMQASYALAARLKNPADGIVNAPIDQGTAKGILPPDSPLRVSQSVNYDDGDRNFGSGALTNNRISLLGELNLTQGNYGAQLRADAFADGVYLGVNDNNSPSTVNKDGSSTEFTSDARRFDGRRIRLLEAYGYGTWHFGTESSLQLRGGRHVSDWGESLFFSGIALAQSPSDATKSNVPGADVKSILLPVDQVSMQLSVTNRLTLLAQYKLEFKADELDPVGTYFSTADVIGPGAKFVIGPGIRLPNAGELKPSDFGQYGAGIKIWWARIRASVCIGCVITAPSQRCVRIWAR